MSKLLGTLRVIRFDELELMLSWRNSFSVRENMYTRHLISRQEHAAWWERTQAAPDRQYFMYENMGEPTGIVGYTNIDLESKNACWAFYASPGAPKGTGSRMEFLALDYAFGVLGLHKLYCEVLAFNTSVLKLHEKFGFKIEGIFPEQHSVDGRFVDVYRLGLFSSAWLETREAMQDKLIRLLRGS